MADIDITPQFIFVSPGCLLFGTASLGYFFRVAVEGPSSFQQRFAGVVNTSTVGAVVNGLSMTHICREKEHQKCPT
jgi:hypothetical protein